MFGVVHYEDEHILEAVIWKVSKQVEGFQHDFKYRLFYYWFLRSAWESIEDVDRNIRFHAERGNEKKHGVAKSRKVSAGI